MKHTKLITGLTALVTTTMLFTGCSGSYTDFDNPIIATKPTEITIPQTNHKEFDSYKMGDYVYVVYYSEGAGLEVRLGIVVTMVDNNVVVTHSIMSDGKDLEAMLAEITNSSGDVDDSISFYPIEDCYKTSDEALAVTGKEPLESLETPYGSIFDNE